MVFVFGVEEHATMCARSVSFPGLPTFYLFSKLTIHNSVYKGFVYENYRTIPIIFIYFLLIYLCFKTIFNVYIVCVYFIALTQLCV